MNQNDRNLIAVNRLTAVVFIVLLSVLVSFGTFMAVAHFDLGIDGEERPTLDPGAPQEGNVTEASNFEALNTAYQTILANYVDPDSLTSERLVEGAIEGMVESIEDPYSMYFDASALKEFQEETMEGEYSGIGVSVLDVEGYVTVITVFEGVPAATTPYETAEEDDPIGLKPGDRIVEVDGVDVVGMSTEHVSELIRGPVGESVSVTVEREVEGTYEDLVFDIQRERVEIPTVTSKVTDDAVGVLTITNFSGHTPEQVAENLEELETKGVEGLVIDVRNNPGGTLSDCIATAEFFLPPGDLIRIVDREGEVEIHQTRYEGYDKPMVVLINEYTASAAEILAGALRDQLEVLLIGQQTFGKGSVQRLYYLDEDRGTGMKLTTQRFLTPSGYNIEQESGLEPDHEVEWPTDGVFGDLEDDPQLQRAIEILRGQ